MMFKNDTKYLVLMCFSSLVLTSFSRPKAVGKTCDIKAFYEAVEPDKDVKVLTTSEEVVEPELILVPAKMKSGTFEVEVTKVDRNIYKLEGTDYYIETRYCYEYATYDQAILTVESHYAYNKGSITFQ